MGDRNSLWLGSRSARQQPIPGDGRVYWRWRGVERAVMMTVADGASSPMVPQTRGRKVELLPLLLLPSVSLMEVPRWALVSTMVPCQMDSAAG